ncbi:MAG: DUF4019 domain-containing protein [Erythrobacter sp.]|nr:DUF4019 domain-containing protein [Erythrobacter sp.]
MKVGIAALALALLVGTPVAGQDKPREVNITQGSTPGWIPSEQLEAEALATLQRFNDLVAADDYDAAYAMIGAGLRAQYPLERFRADRAQSAAARGKLVSRDLIKLTWTKDGLGVPYPGTFVAIDASAVFAKAKRFCGYTILHQAPGADGFTITHFEENVLDNEAFAQIAGQHSELQALLVWRLIARNCRNYSPEPLPETLAEGIEYRSVAEARAAVSAREGIETKVENGWTVIMDQASYSIWSFAPEGASTYPSVVKRWVEPTGQDTSRASMAMRCEAEKRLCDALFDEMALRNGFTPVSLEQ